MKKRFLIIIVLLAGFALNKTTAQNEYKLPKKITEIKNQIFVEVIPQVELISIVQTISKYPTVFGFLMTTDSSSYKTEVINHFSAFKNHPAVKMFDRLSLQPRMLNFNAPSFVMLFTDKNLQVRKDIIRDDFVIDRAGGMDTLQVFLSLLRDFAQKSSFNNFYNEHKEFYSQVIENTLKNLGGIDYISELENLYGKKQHSYSVILVALYNTVGYGNSVLRSDGTREIYNVMGPQKVVVDLPFFGDEDFLKYKIRHEFSHPFINPLTEKYWDYIKDYSANYDFIPEVARKRVCGDWQESINEFTIRAVTTYLAQEESDEIGLVWYEREQSRGVTSLDSLLDKIAFFESNRETFPTLESYFINILDVFKRE